MKACTLISKIPLFIYLLLVYLVPQLLKEQTGADLRLIYASVSVLMAAVAICKSYQLMPSLRSKWYRNPKLHYGLLTLSVCLFALHLYQVDALSVLVNVVSAILLVVLIILSILIW